MDSMTRRLALVAIAACLSDSSAAAPNAWTAMGPEGGTVAKIAFSPIPNVMFAGASGGFYRSQDGGASWQLTFSGFLNYASDVAVDPTDPTRIYVTSDQLQPL